ncbi:unnamed protein product [Callosobruchus maculatus]|uniref:Uncharacterized protein n=1 Tax=Callosobruchus maculatus TaxID=64391 RepID=A0A653DP64_CALMS|nr:unnamed protein product [Callosobruchus maculatus]
MFIQMRSVFLYLASTQCVLSFIEALTADDPFVITLNKPHGSVIRGHSLNSYQGRQYYAYQEIPYAKPPVGEKDSRNPNFLTHGQAN